MSNKNNPSKSNVSLYAALLALTETSIGGILHTLHIPLAGHVLSLNQNVILVFAAKKNSRSPVKFINQVSLLTAACKSLAPLGKKLTPMLAITVQGWLLSVGIGLFGNNLFGVIFGSVLASTWAFIQPLLIAYLLFGIRFYLSLEKLWNELSQAVGFDPKWGMLILAVAVILKVALASGSGAWAWMSSSTSEEKYLAKVQNISNRWNTTKPSEVSHSNNVEAKRFFLALKDTLSPWFLISALISIGFFFWSQNTNATQIATYGLRIFVSGWFFFYLSRSSWAQKLLVKIEK